jgi:hypothetical protein
MLVTADSDILGARFKTKALFDTKQPSVEEATHPTTLPHFCQYKTGISLANDKWKNIHN